MEDHVPRHAQMGAWVLINDRWYKITIIRLCPYVGAIGCLKKLRRNADFSLRPPYAAFEHIRSAKFGSD